MKEKIILITIMVAILGGFFYYFQLRSSNVKEERLAFLFSKKQECSEAGQRYFELQGEGLETIYISNPEYAYNEKLNTCLISYDTYFGAGLGGSCVEDVFTGRRLFHYSYINENETFYENGGKILVSDPEAEFNKKKVELFNQ